MPRIFVNVMQQNQLRLSYCFLRDQQMFLFSVVGEKYMIFAFGSLE